MEPDPTLQPHESVLGALETSIVQAYATSLLFLGFAIRCQRSRSKYVDAPFKLGDAEKYTKRLLECGDKLAHAADGCEKHCNHLNRAAVKDLRDLAEESRQAIRHQGYVGKIYSERTALTMSVVT